MAKLNGLTLGESKNELISTKSGAFLYSEGVVWLLNVTKISLNHIYVSLHSHSLTKAH